MNEKDDFALVRMPTGAIKEPEPGAKRILASIVADTLALAMVEPTRRAGRRSR